MRPHRGRGASGSRPRAGGSPLDIPDARPRCRLGSRSDGRSLGKPLVAGWPRSAGGDAGRSAYLITGHCLVHPGGEVSAAASTVRIFAEPDDGEIAAYVATGEPLQVAGGFTRRGTARRSCQAWTATGQCDRSWDPLLRTMVREAGLRWTDLWESPTGEWSFGSPEVGGVVSVDAGATGGSDRRDHHCHRRRVVPATRRRHWLTVVGDRHAQLVPAGECVGRTSSR